MAYKAARNIDVKKPRGKSAGSRQPSIPEDAADRAESVSKLSHDIRTQLYIIIGFAELMLEEVPGKINEEQRRNLNDVLNSGKRLSNLLEVIVARSKSTSAGAGGQETLRDFNG